MKKGQMNFDFIVLGIIISMLAFAVAYRYKTFRITKYANLENHLQRSRIIRESHQIPSPVPYEDKLLVSTEYFSYYVPSCLSNMTNNCPKYKTQTQLRDAFSQIVGQLDDQGIDYNLTYYNNLFNSINYYINAESINAFIAENIMDKAYHEYEEDLLKTDSPIAKQNAELTRKIINQIKSLKK